MKETTLAIAFGGLALLAIGSLMGERKARRKYRKGWKDGVKCGMAVKELEHTLVKILTIDEEEES